MTLRKARDLYPDKVAVVDGDRSITYARIGERVNALARFFQARDIKPQDRISILEVNSLAFLETYYAAAGIGAILNPLNYRLAPKEIALILRDSGSRWLVTGSRFASLVKGILEEDTPLQGILWIGDSPVGSRHFNGKIDDVRIYKRALVDSEIEDNYIGDNFQLIKYCRKLFFPALIF